MRSTILISIFFIAGTAFCATDVQSIIRQSVAANQADWNAAPKYSWTEEDRTDQGERTYDVTMIDGSPWRRLIKIDGVPLPTEDRQREKQKLEAVTRKRHGESPASRQERIARYQKERERDHLLMDQITEAFNFTLAGSQTIDAREVYVLRATPREGYNPPNKEARVLTGMEGQLWIDTQTFQWAKVTAQVIHPVSIIDFFARVEPGTEFELEKAPVTQGIWLPKHFSMKSSSRILSLFWPPHSGGRNVLRLQTDQLRICRSVPSRNPTPVRLRNARGGGKEHIVRRRHAGQQKVWSGRGDLNARPPVTCSVFLYQS